MGILGLSLSEYLEVQLFFWYNDIPFPHTFTRPLSVGGLICHPWRPRTVVRYGTAPGHPPGSFAFSIVGGRLST